MSESRIPVTYVARDRRAWEADEQLAPVVGQGVIDEDGKRYRVVDVWVNHDNRRGGIGGSGVYAFLEPATASKDRPAALYPGYYADRKAANG